MQQYAIAEEFDSIQGEGHWVGTAMRFIRFAGCNVGQLIGMQGVQSTKPNEEYKAVCTLWDGRTFGCDTNYMKHYSKSLDELLDPVWQNHICLTGGEPLIHDLSELIKTATARGLMVHLETSGTRCPDWLKLDEEMRHKIWISVSPKLDCLQEMISFADEIKILVDERFSEKHLFTSFLSNSYVYLQPVNDEMTINKENLEKCQKIQRRFPEFRISCQLHKFMNVR